MKRLISLLSIMMTACGAYAQSIVCEKQGSTAVQLGEGKAAVSFVSSQSDWVIKSIKGDSEQPRSKSADGKKFVYEFRMDVSKDHERTYILGRKGSAITDQCVVKSLRPGIRVTFNLEEQADTLQRIEAQLGSSPGVYPVEGKACVEITTAVKGLTITTGWPMQESVSSNGARVINVIVDVNELKRLESSRDSLATVMKKLEDADDYENMEGVMKAINELEAKYNVRAEMTIGGKGIKGIPIQLADLGMKEKRRYAVVSITETFESLFTHAEELYAAFPNHAEFSYFEAAQLAYKAAFEHNDCPHDTRENIRTKRDTLLSIRNNIYLIEAVAAKSKKAETEKGFECDEVYKYLGSEMNYINRLLSYHPEMKAVKELKSQLVERIQSHPKGKFKSGEETIMHKRETLSGHVSFKSKYISIPFERMRVYATSSPKIADSKSRIIGKVNEDGTYSVVKPDGITPLYVYVTGEKDNAHFVAEGTTTLDIIIKTNK